MITERRKKVDGQDSKKVLAVAAFLMVIGMLAVLVMKSPIDADVKAIMLVIIGRCFGYIDVIYAYEFGISRKEMGAVPAPPPTPTTPGAKELVR